MATLLLADHDSVSLKDTTAKALTAALALGHPVHVLVAGHNARAAADAAAKLKGVAKVLLADDANYANQLAEPVAALCGCRRELCSAPHGQARRRCHRQHLFYFGTAGGLCPAGLFGGQGVFERADTRFGARPALGR